MAISPLGRLLFSSISQNASRIALTVLMLVFFRLAVSLINHLQQYARGSIAAFHCDRSRRSRFSCATRLFGSLDIRKNPCENCAPTQSSRAARLRTN